MNRKKVNKIGNRTYTVKELQDFLTKLDCDRPKALELGKKIGMSVHAIDMLRGLLGFTAETPDRIPQEKIDKLIDVFKRHPDESIYQIYRARKDEIGISGGYQTYYAIIRKAGLECNRKRNYWSVFKDKKLIHLREVEKLSFGQIQLQFPERTKNALMQRYEKLKKGAA